MDHVFITNRRKQLGLSQREVAEAVGVSRETINRYERKGQGLTLEAFRVLLDSLGLKMRACWRRPEVIKVRLRTSSKAKCFPRETPRC
jgi:transcriptional regulator with XRE-family HTH domain